LPCFLCLFGVFVYFVLAEALSLAYLCRLD
jgi:hypothetical protein